MAPRIMIVEYEGIVALDVESMLLMAGYHVDALTCTRWKAIQSTQETIPDLALIDISLKGPMDGIELAQVLRERFNLASVFLTGHTDQRTLARASLTRPLGYVTKPFVQTELPSSIELAL
jgi:CheY-like chemotaxis protein